GATSRHHPASAERSAGQLSALTGRQNKNPTFMTHPTRLALFDLDHTLLPLDSDYQWADFLARTGRAGDPAEAQARNEELMERYNAGQLTAEQSAEFMLGLLTRATPPELARWHEDFMTEVIRPAIRDNAIELVQGHLTRGDLCAIVTATNDF